MKIQEIGEDALIARIVSGLPQGVGVVSGPGDDCAVVEMCPHGEFVVLLKTDCLVESVHFLPGTDPEKVGWKALCRPLSDIAAMGGEPQFAMITLATDAARSVEEIEGWYRGIKKAAQRFGQVSIVGGETSRLPGEGAVISVTLIGRVGRDHFFTRSGARPGDCVAVTGWLGGSFESGRHLTFLPRLTEARWLASLEPDIRPSAMMDLSDGLARDLPRLADSSAVPGYRLEFSRIPVHPDCSIESAIGDGEDYELLMTLPAAGCPQLLEQWEEAFPDLPLTVIGEMSGLKERTELRGGWEHFPEGTR